LTLSALLPDLSQWNHGEKGDTICVMRKTLWVLLYLSCWLAPFWVGSVLVRYPALILLGSYALVPTVPWTRSLVLGASMIVGIFASAIRDELASSKRSPVHLGRIVGRSFRSRSTLIGCCASPIVFHSVYMHISAEPDNVLALLTAFQSGFFWQSIVAAAATKATHVDSQARSR
jgi:hypothetical protein